MNLSIGSTGQPDPWCQKLYDFEGDWPAFNRGSLTLEECRRLHATACEAFNVAPVPIRQHQGRKMSYSYSDPKNPKAAYISLRLDHKNPAVVLHETAHHICTQLHSWWLQDHGPTFQGIYFWLLARADVAPREALRASARKHGLRWRETGPQR